MVAFSSSCGGESALQVQPHASRESDKPGKQVLLEFCSHLFPAEMLLRCFLGRLGVWVETFVGPFVLFFLVFFSVGRRSQELGTVTRIVVAGRARIVVAVAERRSIVAFGLLCCPWVSKVSTVTGIGGVLVAKLRTVVAFGFACCPRISERLHIFVCVFFFFRIAFPWSLFRISALEH